MKPSSVTSVQRTTGVKMDFIHGRSTPGRMKISSLIFASSARYSGLKMSPSFASTEMRIESPMPRSSARLSRKLRMYSWLCGSIFS
ncbi:hypothetical protein D3C78_1588030 [compost metagenome]